MKKGIVFLVLLMFETKCIGVPYKPNEILVKLIGSLPSNSTGSKDPILKKYDIKSMTEISEKGLTAQSSNQQPSIYKIEFVSSTINILDVVKEYSTCEGVLLAQPNFIYEAMSIPNDPDFKDQWGLSSIEVPDTWELSSGNPSVSIAIIDTGISSSHPDLPIPSFSWNFFKNSSDADGEVGHGTQIAGVIASKMNNRIGGAGLAPRCSILNLKADNNQGYFFTSTLIQALDAAIVHQASVINLSLGGFQSTFGGSEDQFYKDKIAAVIAHNIPVVAAAGNASVDLSIQSVIPACYPGVIAVSALKQSDSFDDSYSNYGSRIDLSAPGTNIFSTYSTLVTQGGLSFITNDYAHISGTSMAAPFVTGVIALLKSLSPNLTVSEIYTILTQSADDLGNPGKDNYYGYGKVNARKAVLALNTQAPEISHTPASYLDTKSSTLISATITDHLAWSQYPIATLYYRFYNQNTALQAWKKLPMNKVQDTYTGIVPKPPENTTQIRYYFVATDPNFTTTYPSLGESGPLVVSTNSVVLPQEKGLILEGPDHGPVFNAPNPFNPIKGPTYFCYSINKDAQVQIMIYTLNAQLIKRLDIQDFVGYHEVAWDGRDNDGDFVPNGVYLMVIKASANGKSVVKRNKIAVLRKD